VDLTVKRLRDQTRPSVGAAAETDQRDARFIARRFDAEDVQENLGALTRGRSMSAWRHFLIAMRRRPRRKANVQRSSPARRRSSSLAGWPEKETAETGVPRRLPYQPATGPDMAQCQPPTGPPPTI